MNIRVKNLVSEISIGDLQKLFAKYGTVSSVSLISDQAEAFGTRHIALIQMPVDEEAMAAIKALNGTKVKNFAITLTEHTVKK